MLLEIFQTFEMESCLIISSLVLTSWYMLVRKHSKMPPSPGIALPLVGHLYLLKKNPRKQFEKWGKELGGIFSFTTGFQTVVFLTSYERIKEAFLKKGDYFSDRPSDSFISTHVSHNEKGITNASGSNWKEQRTTALSILRNFGMGKNLLAERTNAEISYYLQELASENGKPFNIKTLTNVSIANVICGIIFGKRYDYEDVEFITLMNHFNEIMRINSGIAAINFVPFLEYIPFDPFETKKLLHAVTESRAFGRKMINTLKEKYDPTNLDSLIVAYIHEMKKEEKLGHSKNLDELNLERIIDTLFIAGTETTSTTILWSVLFSLHYPDMQQRIYQEIVDNVGMDRVPTIQDKPKLKYLTSFIMETQRLASIVPLGLFHMSSQEASIGEYTIPKGTQVISCLDGVHRDEDLWENADKFRPERFLDAQGNVAKREELIPFSIGRRACLGEAIAKMELFLYLSAMFQKFEFLPVDPNNLPPLTETMALTVKPLDFKVRCVERKKLD